MQYILFIYWYNFKHQFINRVNINQSQGLLHDAMPVGADLWQIRIGIFNFWIFAKLIKSKFQLNSNGMEVSYFFIFCVLIVLKICCDIELNPKPIKVKPCNNFSLCHWNLNSIADNDFPKFLNYLKPITLTICTLYVFLKHTVKHD